MTKTIDALVEALTEALGEYESDQQFGSWTDRARAALAQARAEQAEPLAELHPYHLRPSEHWCREVLLYSGRNPGDYFKGENTRVKLYTTPQQIPEHLDVRKIMLRVVPGYDGSGEEIYAKNVDEVVEVLSDMGLRLEDYELGITKSPVSKLHPLTYYNIWKSDKIMEVNAEAQLGMETLSKLIHAGISEFCSINGLEIGK